VDEVHSFLIYDGILIYDYLLAFWRGVLTPSPSWTKLKMETHSYYLLIMTPSYPENCNLHFINCNRFAQISYQVPIRCKDGFAFKMLKDTFQ
jgi:hypothetical protein